MIVQIINGLTVTSLCDGSDRTPGKLVGPAVPFVLSRQQVTQKMQGLRAPAQSVVDRGNALFTGDLVVDCQYAVATVTAALFDFEASIYAQSLAAGAFLKVTDGSTVRATQDHLASPSITQTWVIEKITPKVAGVRITWTFSITVGGPLVPFS